jgi:D-3-phosphoglycerate dehydrogenase
LQEALVAADIVTLHASGNAAILGSKEFECMKRGVFLLNASRGDLVDENALLNALDNGIVAGAWLDTFPVEPYNGPLTAYQQVILTPHAATYSMQCRIGMEMEAVQNLLAGLDTNG